MIAMASFLSGLGPWNWLILALLLYGLETIVPGVHFVWFGTAAIVVGLLVFGTGITWPWQLVAFAVIAIGTVFIVRKFARSDAQISDLPDLNVRGAQYVGRDFVVEESIRGGRGRIRVGDTLWQAEGEDAPVGTRVRVKSVNDSVLMVERAPT
jgi:membrane protein implicated in regulation of membrane protease activity